MFTSFTSNPLVLTSHAASFLAVDLPGNYAEDNNNLTSLIKFIDENKFVYHLLLLTYYCCPLHSSFLFSFASPTLRWQMSEFTSSPAKAICLLFRKQN